MCLNVMKEESCWRGKLLSCHTLKKKIINKFKFRSAEREKNYKVLFFHFKNKSYFSTHMYLSDTLIKSFLLFSEKLNKCLNRFLFFLHLNELNHEVSNMFVPQVQDTKTVISDGTKSLWSFPNIQFNSSIS